MPKRSIRRLAMGVLALLIVAGFLLVDSSAQRRRKRRASRPSAPRITNPAIYQPSPSDNTNSNSSGDTSNVNSSDNVNTQTETQTSRPTTEQDPEGMRQTIRTLSNQVDRLTDKISQMDEAQRSLVDLERLSRAEQRATQLRTELRDVQAKEADLEARAEDIDYAIKPENIERSVAGFGSTRPEDVREQRRRQLENEKVRVRKQLDQLAASRMQIEQAIAASDVEIERLHKRLDAADAAAIENAKTRAQTEGASSQPPSSAKPSPSPYPPR
jgi:chromosome segregation ATPase